MDGGLLSNYAVSVCSDEIDSTFGIKLVSGGAPVVPIAPKSAWDYLKGLLLTMLQAHDHEDYASNFYDRTIHVPTGNIGTYSFSLGLDQKLALLKQGYDTAWEFFDSHPNMFPPYETGPKTSAPTSPINPSGKGATHSTEAAAAAGQTREATAAATHSAEAVAAAERAREAHRIKSIQEMIARSDKRIEAKEKGRQAGRKRLRELFDE